MELYTPPDLVIEIGKATIVDDRTVKRTLYEEAGVGEYWAVDGEQMSIYAFEMIERGSRRIDELICANLEFLTNLTFDIGAPCEAVLP